jgi:negative regulator of genetic competence, sporulation and motility
VDNFENAEVPECPDLVQEGLIKQHLTTYEQLIARYVDPTAVFLTKSFAFNMQRSMLVRYLHCFHRTCLLHTKSSRQAQHKRSSLLEYLTQLPCRSVEARLLIYGK